MCSEGVILCMYGEGVIYVDRSVSVPRRVCCDRICYV